MTITTTEPVAGLYAARLRADFERMMQARSSVATARWNNPSQMGHPCDRFLVLRRTKGAMQKPFPPSLQARFLMGTEIGKLAVRMIMEMGWDVKSIERPAEWEKYQISGRPDLEARPSGNGNGHAKYVPFEVKMAVNDRAPCSYCGYERRKPQPLGPVMGLSAETERLLVCRPCQKAIRDSFAATREIRVRLQVAVEEAAFLAGADPE